MKKKIKMGLITAILLKYLEKDLRKNQSIISFVIKDRIQMKKVRKEERQENFVDFLHTLIVVKYHLKKENR